MEVNIVIGQDMVNRLYDCQVVDPAGEKIGAVKRVWLDDQTGDPLWASVHTGMFGMRESFVPLQRAELDKDQLRVPVDKEQVRQSPKIDAANDHMTEQEQAELYRYYGFGPQRTSPEGSGQRRGQRPADTGQRMDETSHGRHSREAAARRNATGDTAMRDSTAKNAAMGDTRAGGTTMGDTATGGTAMRGTTAGETAMDRTAAGGRSRDDEAMTRSEEHLRVSTEETEIGKVRLVKHVVTEEEEITVPVSHEEVRLVREPITDANREAAMRGQEITEAEHEVTLHGERPVVEKETTPIERVRLTKERVTSTETVTGEVRREEIDVEDERGRRPRG